MTYHAGPGPSGGSCGTSCGLHTPWHDAVYGLRVSPQQSSDAAEQAACAASAQLRAQMASAFTSFDINDAFLNVTVARAEQTPMPTTELSAYT